MAGVERKTNKYSSLTISHILVFPVAAETVAVINKDGMDFLSDLGRCITQDLREGAFLFQRLNATVSLFWVTSPIQTRGRNIAVPAFVKVFSFV